MELVVLDGKGLRSEVASHSIEVQSPWGGWFPAVALVGIIGAVTAGTLTYAISRKRGRPRKLQILFLTANPANTPKLNLNKEFKIVDEELQKAKERDLFDLEQRHAVSVSELQGLLLHFEPQIIYFSGHGSEENALVFENSEGNSEIAPPNALADLFRIVNGDKKTVKCVVLNACYSEVQAEAISKYVPCVIGMTNAITDDAAIKFAASFYRALGYGQSVLRAFELGRNDIALHDLPEEAVPRLKLGTGVDPAKIFFAKE